MPGFPSSAWLQYHPSQFDRDYGSACGGGEGGGGVRVQPGRDAVPVHHQAGAARADAVRHPDGAGGRAAGGAGAVPPARGREGPARGGHAHHQGQHGAGGDAHAVEAEGAPGQAAGGGPGPARAQAARGLGGPGAREVLRGRGRRRGRAVREEQTQSEAEIQDDEARRPRRSPGV
ncbi:hypothetical protein ON010_g11362 [Phytophthora cinnamomi]|nr:hypothetical protein ON010_g11362 [Phytophthora cinnamomi]